MSKEEILDIVKYELDVGNSSNIPTWLEKLLPQYYNQAIDDAIEEVRKKGENSYRPGSVDVDVPAPYSMIIQQLQSLKK